MEIVAPAAGLGEMQRVAMGGCTPDQKAVDAFDQLAAGGEAAVRPGRLAFQYEGVYLPITKLTCFCEEAGALPIIQLPKESPYREAKSTIDKASVFWINGDEDDFALYDGLEALFYKLRGRWSWLVLWMRSCMPTRSPRAVATKGNGLRKGRRRRIWCFSAMPIFGRGSRGRPGRWRSSLCGNQNGRRVHAVDATPLGGGARSSSPLMHPFLVSTQGRAVRRSRSSHLTLTKGYPADCVVYF